ncbi:hypothetical protein KR49_06430 [Synechococcus sp. KORDI-49]|nr:hypothetical protein KR49_06430 [Synechococcus sp. KORDI-49]
MVLLRNFLREMLILIGILMNLLIFMIRVFGWSDLNISFYMRDHLLGPGWVLRFYLL